MNKSMIAGLLALPLLALTCSHTASRDSRRPTAADRTSAGRPGDQDEPRVRLILTGHLEGHLEPCGCASGQIGGLARRSFRIQQDHEHDLLIEGGDLTADGNALDELKLYTILNILDDSKARYDAVCIGPDDLRLDPETFASYLQAFPQLHFLSADLVARDDLQWPVVPFRDETTKTGAKVRITALTMRLPAGDEVAARTFRLRKPAEAWQTAMKGIEPDRLRILVAHGTMEAIRELAKLDPRPDLIVASNDAHAEPPREPEFVDGVPLVHPGTRGRFVLDVTIARIDGVTKILNYDSIPLHGSRTAKGALEDPSTRQLILQHRFEVKEDQTREKLAGQRPTANGARYVGSKACMGCHLSAYQKWQETPHAHAWETLVNAEATKRYEWPVTNYPDCVGCHTVGYGQVSGFVNPEKTPDLRGVGCEECHGAASEHVKDPENHHLGKVLPTKCTQCHDYEQSPDFEYAERWKRIEHGK